jgi:hypothetical protein
MTVDQLIREIVTENPTYSPKYHWGVLYDKSPVMEYAQGGRMVEVPQCDGSTQTQRALTPKLELDKNKEDKVPIRSADPLRKVLAYYFFDARVLYALLGQDATGNEVHEEIIDPNYIGSGLECNYNKLLDALGVPRSTYFGQVEWASVGEEEGYYYCLGGSQFFTEHGQKKIIHKKLPLRIAIPMTREESLARTLVGDQDACTDTFHTKFVAMNAFEIPAAAEPRTLNIRSAFVGKDGRAVKINPYDSDSLYTIPNWGSILTHLGTYGNIADASEGGGVRSVTYESSHAAYLAYNLKGVGITVGTVGRRPERRDGGRGQSNPRTQSSSGGRQSNSRAQSSQSWRR